MTAELETIAPLPRRLLPAWALSLALHMLLMLALAVGLRRTATPQVEQSVREVGIVLTEPRADRPARYLEEPDAARQTGEAMDSDASPEARASAGPSMTALPGADAIEGLELPELELPGRPSSVGLAEQLVVEDLTAGGRRSTAVLPGLGDEAILAEEAARRAAMRARGPTTQVSLFGSAAAAGHSFVFVIDRSKSMGGQGLNALAAARTELSRSLTHLTARHSFQIVAYHHQCVYLTRPRLVPATDENKRAVGPFIDGLAAFGGTGHDIALRVALSMEPDAIFLMTDGGDPHLNGIQLANLRKLAAGRTSIHSIHFGFGPQSDTDHFMQLLATQNGGSYTYVEMSSRGDR
jgi:hypothetical protein